MTDPKKETTGAAQDDGVAGEEEVAAGMAAESADLARLQGEVERLTDRHLRLAAEFDNYRKRVDRERSELFVRAQAELASRLLDALDDLQRVAEHADTADPRTLLDGVQLVEKKLTQVLESSGLEAVDAEGRVFDPESMEALATVAAEDAAEDDRVADVFQRGYRFKGQLIRPARVRVKQYEV
jgi:molecular chaperone GrpE